MRHRTALLAVALAVGISAGCMLVWELGPPSAGFVEHVIVPAGLVLRGPAIGNISFEVPRAGGVLLGTGQVDHTSLDLNWWEAGQGARACGLIPPHPKYHGPSWTYSVDVTLPPGHYFWGPWCSDLGNVTFTQPLVIVTP